MVVVMSWAMCGGACICVWALALSALLASAARAQEPAGAPRCLHPSCQYVGHNDTVLAKYITLRFYSYMVEGHAITIQHYEEYVVRRAQTVTLRSFEMFCNGASVLDSPALPSAEQRENMQGVRLWNCPLPAAGSLADSLDVLNVTLCHQDPLDKPCRLELEYLPAEPPLAPRHFLGLELIQKINIYRYNKTARGTAERGFLTGLKNLHNIHITDVSVPAGELDAAPASLDYILLSYTGTRRLPERIHSSTNLRTLIVRDDVPLDAGGVPPGLNKLELRSPATTLRLDAAPALETLLLHNWVEPLPPQIELCDALKEVKLVAPAMRALPDRWLASCSRLEMLEITNAKNLTTLPQMLFTPFKSILTRLTLTGTALEALPEDLLESSVNINTFQLNKNGKLKTLPRNLFARVGYQLSKIDLSRNDLDGGVFDALEQLTATPLVFVGTKLLDLDLSENPRIGDVCCADGYSRIRNNQELRELRLRGTGVSRICRDWREEMPELKLLDLSNTRISEISYEDLQYPRTAQARVLLRGAPVSSVRLTREDYIKAARAAPSFTTVELDAEVKCDCSLYWARRALDHPLAQYTLPGIHALRCAGGDLLRDVPPGELVCPAPEECAAAALPAGCACVARPDDDTAHDRWLVRVRCERSLLGFELRRFYPFYPVYPSISEGFYLKASVGSLN